MNKLLLFGLFAAFTIAFVSCGNEEEEKSDEMNSGKPNANMEQMYKPSFGLLMNQIQIHHAKLWFAGAAGNWDLAKYELSEIIDNETAIKQFCTDRPETQTISMIKSAVDGMKSALESASVDEFKKSFTTLTNSCNSCHAMTNHGFIKVKIPETEPIGNQIY